MAPGQPSSYGNRARGTMITEEYRAKPPELVSLYAATSAAFKILKEEFQVPDIYELALHHVDAAELRLTNTVDIAAIAMRKVQALRWVAKPGVETTNDVVVALAADLSRALDHLVQHCDRYGNTLTSCHPANAPYCEHCSPTTPNPTPKSPPPPESHPAESDPHETVHSSNYEKNSTNTTRIRYSLKVSECWRRKELAVARALHHMQSDHACRRRDTASATTNSRDGSNQTL
jgi:hypothetical protein